MRACLIHILLFLAVFTCVSRALPIGSQTTPLNSDRYNATGAVNGTIVEITAPACNTTYSSGGCMKNIDPVPNSIGAQRWSYTASVVNGNATRCTFVFSLHSGETTLGWGLVATSNCAI